MVYFILGSVFFALLGSMVLNPINRPGTGLLLGLFLGPIGLLLAFGMKSNVETLNKQADEKRIALGNIAKPQGRDEIDCPFCAEPILRKASVCKHCGNDVVPSNADSEVTHVEAPGSPASTDQWEVFVDESNREVLVSAVSSKAHIDGPTADFLTTSIAESLDSLPDKIEVMSIEKVDDAERDFVVTYRLNT